MGFVTVAADGRDDLGGRSLSRDAMIYGLASLITQVALLVAVPVYARVLGPSGVGVIELLIVGLNLVALVATGGLDLASLRLFYSDEELPKRQSLLSTGLIAVAALSLLAAASLLFLTGFIERSYLQGFDGDESVVVAVLTLPLLVTTRYVREILRARRRPVAYLVNSGTAALLQAALGVVLVAWFGFGPEGVMIGYLLGSAVTLVMGVASSRRFFVARFNRSVFRSLIGFGVPLVWTGLAGWSLMFVDRLVLSAFVAVDEIGVYAIASRIGMSLTLVVYAFNRAWTPAVLELAEEDRAESRTLRVGILPKYLAVVGWLAVGVSVLADQVVRLFAGTGFGDAADLVPILAVGMLFLAFVPVIQAPMLIDRRTGVLARGAAGAALANLLMNLLLVPVFGVVAAAWATLLALLLQTVAYWWAAQRIERLPYDHFGILRLLAIVFALSAAGWLPLPAGTWGLALRLALVLVYPAAVVALRVVSVEDVRSIVGMVSLNVWERRR